MPAPSQYTKAKLQIEGKAPFDVLFNPTEYSISKSNEWKYEKVTGTAFTPPQFGGGNPRELTLSLLLDKSLLGKDPARPRHHGRAVQDDGGAGGLDRRQQPRRAAVHHLHVGQRDDVQVRLHVADGRFKLFRPNGDPIRADVKMTLKQAEAASTASSNGANRGTNPTTRANAGHGVHTVKDGDSLPSIAYEAYGDATTWRAIADANGIENPMHLRRGRALSLPRLEG